MRPGPIRVGQDFGPRYHVVKLLGSGGMGVVYQALDRDLGVQIALKVLRAPAPGPKAAQSVIELQRRFRTELLLARKITHKNVIRIHDIGEIDGIRFISMPLVQGPDLATLLAGGPLAPARATRYARQIAAGLVAVHAAGVVHRDLKPANIMIGGDDQALLMDFGIARSSVPTGHPRTVAGAIVGTLPYMAPEQARGEAVDGRTDIYAFGLILYEMLCGPRPNVTMADLVARMKTAPALPDRGPRRVPEALEAIVTRCLQPAPAQRFQTAAELAAALHGISRRQIAGRAGASLDGASLRRAAAILLIAAAAASGYWMWSGETGAWIAGTRLSPRTPQSSAPAPAATAPGTSTVPGIVVPHGTGDRRITLVESGAAAPIRASHIWSDLLEGLQNGVAVAHAVRWRAYSRLAMRFSASPRGIRSPEMLDEFQICYVTADD